MTEARKQFPHEKFDEIVQGMVDERMVNLKG